MDLFLDGLSRLILFLQLKKLKTWGYCGKLVLFRPPLPQSVGFIPKTSQGSAPHSRIYRRISPGYICLVVLCVGFPPLKSLKWALCACIGPEMSSNAGQNPPPSKAINTSNTPAASPTFYATAPADTNAQRRAGGSGSFGTGLSSRNSPTPRNTQSRKNQPKRQKKPRLLDDDEYSESVGYPQSLFSQRLSADYVISRPS